MTNYRPTRVDIDTSALLHNVKRVKQCAPGKKIIAMVKANAYGCGLSSVLPVLDSHVDAFGVASIDEAMAIRTMGFSRDCVLFQGVFDPDELPIAASYHFQCVIHQRLQLQWILARPLAKKIKVWVKVDTGMHRLGIAPHEADEFVRALLNCPWVDDEIGLMTHLACADEPTHRSNQQQLEVFNTLSFRDIHLIRSIANSAAIMTQPDMHADVVRPGIMLYGISPFQNQKGRDLGLIPVMRFVSEVSAIHHYPPNTRIGYGGTWSSDKASIIGVISVGYGDGYPRHIAEHTPTWVNGYIAPIVGRVSMDMVTIDLTNCQDVKIGSPVELWGQHIPVEQIAKQAGTIGYELICQISSRARNVYI